MERSQSEIAKEPDDGPMHASALAVDLGGQHASCALVSGKRVLASESIPLDARAGLAAALPLLAESLRGLLDRAPAGAGPCAGIGFSFCGLVDPRRCRILSTNAKYDDAPGIDLAAWAGAEMGLPLRLENDARTALLGERYAGAAQGFDDVVMMTLGTGIGGTAMIEGRLLHGKHFQAGCLGGHLGVDYRGRQCTCGNVGCMEAQASGWSLPLVCSAHPLYSDSALAALPRIGFEELFRLAASGDACACEVRDECLRVWSAGAVSLIHAYDPEVLVLGGGAMGAAGQILPAMRAYVERRAWTPWGKVEIRAAALGNQASLLGAIPLLDAGPQ
ncbi:MAG: ROK family protein [Bryobacteraceae bacterium]|jgi:glucokinase